MMRVLPALGEHGLADGVVDLVRAGMVQVLALEQNLRATYMLGQALGCINWRWPSNIMLEVVGQLGEKLGILAVAVIGVRKLA